jgi:hypothetical protein
MLRKGLKNLRPPWDPTEELLYWRPRTGKDDAWDVFVHYLPLEDGTFYVTEVGIRPHGVRGLRSVSDLPDGGINARVFRSIKLGTIVEEIRSEERRRVRQHRIRPRDLPPSGTRPGRHGHRDELYKAVAILYLRALERAPYAPYPEMMRQLNKDPKTRYPRDTLRGWVSKARAKGFLTEAPGRRAGGGPGPMLSAEPFDWKSIDDDEAREQLSLVLNRPVGPHEEGEDDVAPLVFEEES